MATSVWSVSFWPRSCQVSRQVRLRHRRAQKSEQSSADRSRSGAPELRFQFGFDVLVAELVVRSQGSVVSRGLLMREHSLIQKSDQRDLFFTILREKERSFELVFFIIPNLLEPGDLR